MRVAAADQAELVGVRAELLLELQAVLERRAGVLELEHLLLLGDAAVEVALVPDLEVGELVVRREEGMGLAVALRLRRLVEPLPLRARLDVLAVELLAEGLDHGEHQAVAQVAVVRDGEDVAAGLLLVRVHPLPELDRVVAAERRVDGERLDLARLVAVVAEDDVAVEVVAAGVRRPLVADEGGEAARVVVLLGRGDRLLPRAPVGARAGEVHEVLRERPLREGDDDLDRRLGALAGLDHVVPLAARRVGEDLRLAREEVGEEAHVVRVIGDHEEVERARELHRLPARGGDLLAAGER